VILHLPGGDDALAHQQLDVAVIARAFAYPAGAQVIDAAVADVGPVGRGLLHNADRTGGARSQLERHRRAKGDHALVRDADREVQESQGIEQWRRCLQKALGDTALSDLGRGLAVGMAAHAIARNQQRGLFRHGDRNAILIAIACTLQA